MKTVYALLCVPGLLLPYGAFLPWLLEHGVDLPLLLQQAAATPIALFAWLDVLARRGAADLHRGRGTAQGHEAAVAADCSHAERRCFAGSSAFSAAA